MFVPLHLRGGTFLTELREGEDRCQVGQDYQEFIAHHWSGMFGLSRLPTWETALGCFDFLVSTFTVILFFFFPMINPLQYSRPENSIGRGAWQATVHGVSKSRTHLSD